MTTRRSFLAHALVEPLLAGLLRSSASCSDDADRDAARGARLPLADIHVHLFGTGDSGSGCVLSRRVTESALFQVLRLTLGVRESRQSVDEGYGEALRSAVEGSGLDAVVLLAHDAVYDAAGRRDRERTHVYVPNDYLFEVTRRLGDRLIPCVSINPQRADALEELERCHALGARVLKVHPPIQGVDVGDCKHAKFFARCAALDVLVMVHTGHEHAAPVIDERLADPRRLRLALDEGCRVVACHSGTGWSGNEPDFLPVFVELMGRYERLWGDTAVLGSGHRLRDVERLLERNDIVRRLVHGSDFPFPSVPAAFSRVLGLRKALGLQSERNALRRDFLLKEALGFGRGSAERAYALVRGATQRDSTRKRV